MSGICGIVLKDHGRPVRPDDLTPMVQALGGSGEGDSFTVGLGGAGLGTRRFRGRLSGVAERTVHGRPLAVAFYGSLYNAGALFPSSPSDPFTGILDLYLKEGMTLLDRLRGEFALALWDGDQQTLYLATDRFRVDPLFYSQNQNGLIFASRIKGIVASPFFVKSTIDPEAIVDVVSYSVIPTPKTIYQEVKKLPPGYLLTYSKGEVNTTPYWEINFLKSDGASEAELARKLKTCFSDSISSRLEVDRASGRIGAFLSGGIDSSTVTGVLNQLTQRPVKCFSIGFQEEKFNEINYARMAARSFGSEHYEYFVSPQDVYDATPRLLEAFDEPFANASAIPTYFCAKLAREHDVDTLYAGDGGDELFGGNERYATQRFFEYYSRVPAWLREPLLKPLVFALADGLHWGPFVKGKKYILRASIPYPNRLTSYGFFNSISISTFFQSAFLKTIGGAYDPSGPVHAHYFKAPAKTELDRQLYIDLKYAISDNDLFKVTRMTEAAGVVVRFPFLDHPFAEFAATIPAEIKMRGRNLRSFFKKAYADLLAPEIRAKKKHGFGLPIPVWLRTDKRLNEMMHDLVLSPQSVQRGYFQKKALEQLVESHKTDETSFYGTALWNLMVLELWHRQAGE